MRNVINRAILPLLAGAALLGSVAGSAAEAPYTIGVSNTVQGNGWREEMICAIKAQALASGKVAKLNIAHRNTDAAGQLEDLRNLISAKVDAIVVNPADPAGIQAALAEATAAGIVVVAVDQAVTEPSAYIISNNQEQYAYLGAKWLFEQLGGKGSVVYMRGAAGASADSDRDKGFKKALAEFPDIKVAQETFTGWQQDQGKQQILDGQKPASQTVLVEPALWENVTDAGKAQLKEAADPSLSPEWPVSISINDWTTYTKDQIVACKGPGE